MPRGTASNLLRCTTLSVTSSLKDLSQSTTSVLPREYFPTRRPLFNDTPFRHTSPSQGSQMEPVSRKVGHAVLNHPRFFVTSVASSELIKNNTTDKQPSTFIGCPLEQKNTLEKSPEEFDLKESLIHKTSLRHSCRLHRGYKSLSQAISKDYRRPTDIEFDHLSDFEADNDRVPWRQRWKLPYHIWKSNFMDEQGCDEKTFSTTLIWCLIPHIFKILIAIFCITFGAFMFPQFDSKMVDLPYEEILLFAFTSVTTIGYGSIVPKTMGAIIFCMIYICLGVPTVFLVLSGFSGIIAETYWTLVATFKGKKVLNTPDPKVMPVVAAMLLLHGHALLGSVLFSWLMPELDFIDSYYLSFVSITTIGFGDISPSPKSLSEAVLIIGYLAVGIIFLATFITSLTRVIRRIHYIGRNFTGAEHVEVYFGGSKFTIGELLKIVSHQFNVTPQQLRDVIFELDELINLSGSPDTIGGSGNHGDVETITEPQEEHLVLSPGFNCQSHSVPLSINTLGSRNNNYASRFNDEERQKLIQAVGVMCHLSDTGNRSVRSTQPLFRKATIRSANGYILSNRIDISDRQLPPDIKRSVSAYNNE